jgi:adenosine deaminase
MSGEISLELLQRLPKTDLHCHLDGSVRLDTVIDLARKQHVTLPTSDRGELHQMLVAGEHLASIDDYLLEFDITFLLFEV